MPVNCRDRIDFAFREVAPADPFYKRDPPEANEASHPARRGYTPLRIFSCVAPCEIYRQEECGEHNSTRGPERDRQGMVAHVIQAAIGAIHRDAAVYQSSLNKGSDDPSEARDRLRHAHDGSLISSANAFRSETGQRGS